VSNGGVHIVGTRTFAAEVADFARDAGLGLAGLLEPRDPERVGTTIHELPVESLEDGPGTGSARSVIVGTGDRDRREIVSRLAQAGWEPVALVHPRAHLAPSATVGDGALLGPLVGIGARAVIGDHVVLGRGALVGHHTSIGAFATLSPGVNIAGNVRVANDAFLGMGAVVRDHVVIGAGAIVAMGAVVVEDVPPGAEVRGLPARPHANGTAG
jgi:sugar O-acyltransferase (sialic acid O-acetyltransferase NeuD family)